MIAVKVTTCTCCLQRPVTDLGKKDRKTGEPLCDECYSGMEQSTDEQGNLLPEALFYTQEPDG